MWETYLLLDHLLPPLHINLPECPDILLSLPRNSRCVNILGKRSLDLGLPHPLQRQSLAIPMQLSRNRMRLSPALFDIFLNSPQRMHKLGVVEIMACDAPAPFSQVVQDGAFVVVGLDYDVC